MSSTNIRHNRFKDALWYGETFDDIIIGGAGGIGSWVALLLARAGFRPVPVDFDTVEEHNLGGQAFTRHHIGHLKVDAVRDIVMSMCAVDIEYIGERVTEGFATTRYTFSGFDQMAPRKILFDSWCELSDPGSDRYEPESDAIFIDGRLQAEHMQILCIRGNDEEAKEKFRKDYLFSNEEVEDAPCTLRQTTHAAAMIAAHMVGFFTNHIANVKTGDDVREVPFYWEYFIPNNYLEVKYAI